MSSEHTPKRQRITAGAHSDSDVDENELVSLSEHLQTISTVDISLNHVQLERFLGLPFIAEEGKAPKNTVISSIVEPRYCSLDLTPLPQSSSGFDSITDFNVFIRTFASTSTSSQHAFPTVSIPKSPSNDTGESSQSQQSQQSRPKQEKEEEEEMVSILKITPAPLTSRKIEPKFNKLSGIITFANATCLFMNLDKSTYANMFAIDKSKPDPTNPTLCQFGFSYYASPSQKITAKPLQRILASMDGITTNPNRPKLYAFVRDESAKKYSSAKDPLQNQYVFWGEVEVVGFDAEASPIPFLLRPVAFAKLLTSPAFVSQIRHIKVKSFSTDSD